VGSSPARELRRKGKIPAVLYGPETEPILLSVNIIDLEQAMQKGTSSQVLFSLVIQNDKTNKKAVMIKELQIHPVSRNFLHVDFYEIDMNRKINVKVPVTIKGKSKGIELGGTLQILRRELEVLCLPLKVPESIEVDITDLDIGDSVHVDEIPLEGDIEIPFDVNFTVVTMLSPKFEEEPEELEEELEEAEEAEGAAAEEETPEAPDKE
jgi:large subunit ribosomal protein L25